MGKKVSFAIVLIVLLIAYCNSETKYEKSYAAPTSSFEGSFVPKEPPMARGTDLSRRSKAFWQCATDNACPIANVAGVPCHGRLTRDQQDRFDRAAEEICPP
jgi:hypothetical protein